MKHDELLAANCAISRTGAILGERWVFAILRASFVGARTFEQYARLTGVARNILTDRLNRLCDVGVLERRVYEQHERRSLHEYRLTEAGLDLYPIVVAVMQWGDKHGGFVHGPPVQLVHTTCGAVADPTLVCSSCGGEIHAREIRPVPGPGAETPAPPLVIGAG